MTIIQGDIRGVLSGRELEFDEMSGYVTLGGEPIRDCDESGIRALIEKRFIGSQDKNGVPLGLQLSVGDVHDAIVQVAHERPFHPVRRYLESLTWDGVPRLATLVGEVLRADPTRLNIALLRKWFISAVARPLQPGVKVDTMLILVGPQGSYKSTFFRVLAGEFFGDSAIDIHSKDSFATLRRSWILEWSELESLKRARDAAATKAFLTSSVDRYRPAYGRNDVEVPRSGVIAGTTNDREFLTDETGSRRFWPVVTGRINIDAVVEQRDQLWAEAVAAYQAGEPWHLVDEQERELCGVHEVHAVGDAWDDLVIGWAELRTSPFSTGDVLSGPLEKPTGQWTRGDEMRVGRILTRAGYTKKRREYKQQRTWAK